MKNRLERLEAVAAKLEPNEGINFYFCIVNSDGSEGEPELHMSVKDGVVLLKGEQ